MPTHSTLGHPLSQYIRCKPSGDPYGSINYKEMEGMHGVQSIGVQYSKLEKGMERLINSEGVAIRRGGKLLSVDYTTAGSYINMELFLLASRCSHLFDVRSR
jgi:hypothetical protein